MACEVASFNNTKRVTVDALWLELPGVNPANFRSIVREVIAAPPR